MTMIDENDFTESFNDEAFPANDNPSTETDLKAVPKKPALVNIPNNLLSTRQIFLNDGVNDKSMTSVIMQMRALAAQNKEPITLWINSPGGSVRDGLALYDTMRDLMNDGITIKTVAFGIAASMGSFLLSAGSPGHRTMLPNTQEMTHQPSRVMGRNNVDDAEVATKKMQQVRRRMESHYANFMGLDYTKPKAARLIKNYMGPDVYLNAYTAKRLGLIDNIALQGYNGKPDSSISQQFLRKSVETDIELDRLEYQEIDDGPDSIDPARHVKKLIKYRDKQMKKRDAEIHLQESLKLDP